MHESTRRTWTYIIGIAFTLACVLMTLAFFAVSILLCGFFIVSEDTSWLMFFATMGIGAFFAAVTLVVYRYFFVFLLGHDGTRPTKWLALGFSLFLTLAPFLLLAWYLASCHHVTQKVPDPWFSAALAFSGVFFGAVTGGIYYIFKKGVTLKQPNPKRRMERT